MAAPFPVEVQVQEVRRDVDADEILAEAVRSFPVLYNKSLREFKDNQKQNRNVALRSGMFTSLPEI